VRNDAWIDCVLTNTNIDPAAVIEAGMPATSSVFQSTGATVVARCNYRGIVENRE
jgi:hypothetical protein